MTPGIITLQHQHGPEVRDLTKAEMWLNWMPSESEDRELDCKIVLWFEARNSPSTEQMSPSGFTSIDGEFLIKASSFSEDEFVGSRFSIPRGYDAASEEYLTRLYYFEHLELDEVEIEVLGFDEGRYHICVRATCELDTYGNSGPRSAVVIDGWFAWSDEETVGDETSSASA